MQTLGKSLGAVIFTAWFALGIVGFGCSSSEPQKVEPKVLGQTCAADAECASQHCGARSKACTKTCAHDKECDQPLVCRGLDSGSGMMCDKPEGSKVGSSCTNAAECDHGLCVKKADAPNEAGFCSRTCMGSGECPDGYKICDTVGEGTSKMCLLGDDKTPIGERAKFVAPTQVGTPTKPTTSSSSSGSSTSSSGSSSSSSGASGSSSSGSSSSSSSGLSFPDAGLPLPFDAGVIRPPDGGIVIRFPTKKK